MSFLYYAKYLALLMLVPITAISGERDRYLNAYAGHFGISLSGKVQQTGDLMKLSKSFRQVSDLTPERVRKFVEENPASGEVLVRYIHSLPSNYITETNKQNLLFQVVSTLAGLKVQRAGQESLNASAGETRMLNSEPAVQELREARLPQTSTHTYVAVDHHPVRSKNDSWQDTRDTSDTYLKNWRVGGGIQSVDPIFKSGSVRTVNGVVVEDLTFLETYDANQVQGFFDLSYKVPRVPVRLGGKLLSPVSIKHTLENVPFKHSRPWVLAPYIEINSPVYFGRIRPFVAYSTYSYDSIIRFAEDEIVFPGLAYQQDIERISVGADYHWSETWLVRLVGDFVESEYEFGNLLFGSDKSTEVGLGVFRIF
jgi:hypothetical protein